MKSKIVKGYKFVTSDLKSKNGVCQWSVGEWKHHDGKLAMCESGLHASSTPLDSLQYTYGDRWFIVEAKGILGKVEGDKFVCSDMKLVQEIPVSKVLVPFAIACARHCYANFKKYDPKDTVVLAAIEAAEKCFADPSKENVDAAWSAAWSAARSAARSAEKQWQQRLLHRLIKKAIKAGK
mgnify:CR=1 FL=1